MSKHFLTEWIVCGNNFPEIKANVPGDVTSDLCTANLIKDPLFGLNLKSLSNIFENDWTYKCIFDADKSDLEKDRISLCFDGIDTLSEITLNGVNLGITDNMYRAYCFDVKNVIKSNGNILTVKILSSTAYIRKINDGTDYRALFTQDRLYIRKAQCHFGWDWAPALPGCGIWLPVYITAGDNITIDNVRVRSNTDGNLIFSVTLDNNKGAITAKNADEYTIRLTVDGKTVDYGVNGSINIINAKIENPCLWWPNGYGEQFLYDYKVELLHCNKVEETKCGRFGLRSIVLEQKGYDLDKMSFCFIVNGRRIFCKGSNWVPHSTMTGTVVREDYKKLLYAAKQANYNMLRVWGGGVYEKDDFYDLCDEFGILVWQDFMFACSAIPTEIDGLEEKVVTEVKYQIKRLRNHPSIAVWSGGNEYFPSLNGKKYTKGNEFIRVYLRGLCAEFDGDNTYIHNSPYGNNDDEWDFRTGDAHVSCMDIIVSDDTVESFRKIITKLAVNFVSEAAILGSSRLRSLKKFIPSDELNNYGESWDYHFVKNPYAINGATFLEKEKSLVRGFFGEIGCLEDFVKNSMIAHGEILRSEIDFARSNKHCRGYMNWMYNDIWGCGTWAVIDYYFEKKPALYFMQRSFAPVRAYICEQSDFLGLTVCNDGANTLQAEIVYSLKKFDGEVVCERKIAVCVLPDEVYNCPVEFEGNGDYMTVVLNDENGQKSKEIYFHNLWKNVKFSTKLEVEAKNVNAKECSVSITALEFARTVFIDYPDNNGLTYSDNYFDLEKGDKKTVRIVSDKEIDASAITLLTYADKWQD